MITDPYKILEISPNATDDEVKRAYRDLSRKYHPDSYVNNPLSDLAEEKFKEVQEAYNQIMKDRENGYSSSSSYGQGSYGTGGFGTGGFGSGGFGGFNKGGFGGSAAGGFGTNYADSAYDTPELSEVARFLNQRRYQDALNRLNTISDHNARWYYYGAIANNGVGNNVQAYNYAQTAYQLDPTNQEYANLLDRLQYGNGRYQATGTGYGRGFGDDPLDCCCKLWAADTCCECMGGDLCSCM